MCCVLVNLQPPIIKVEDNTDLNEEIGTNESLSDEINIDNNLGLFDDENNYDFHETSDVTSESFDHGNNYEFCEISGVLGEDFDENNYCFNGISDENSDY